LISRNTDRHWIKSRKAYDAEVAEEVNQKNWSRGGGVSSFPQPLNVEQMLRYNDPNEQNGSLKSFKIMLKNTIHWYSEQKIDKQGQMV
jgi:hypothetical protein